MISEDDIREMFDIICCSMDFGSGFLDTPQVDLLRKVAVELGVDPMEATPSNQAENYPHQFNLAAYYSALRAGDPYCGRCYKRKDHRCHE